MRTLRSRARGFTLIEVLMALAIFAIGSLGALSMMMSIASLNASSAQMMESQEVANWLLEQFEVRPATDASIDSAGTEVWASVTNFKSGSAVTVGVPDIGLGAPSAQAAVRYQVKWVSDAQTGLGGNVRHWRVRVRWPKNRDLRTLDATAPNYVDCFNPAVYASGACVSTEYHTYRKLN